MDYDSHIQRYRFQVVRSGMNSSYYGDRATTDTSSSRYNTTTAARGQSFRMTPAAAANNTCSPMNSTIVEASPGLGYGGGRSSGRSPKSLEVVSHGEALNSGGEKKTLEVSIDKHNQHRNMIDSGSTNSSSCAGTGAGLASATPNRLIGPADSSTTSALLLGPETKNCETFL